MSWILGEGFDFYASIADITLGAWDSAPSGSLSTNTPYSSGRSFSIPSSVTTLQKNAWGSNDTTFIIALSVLTASAMTGAATTGLFITFGDVANDQVTVQFAQDGNVYVRGGGTTAGIVSGGTWAAGLLANTWYQFQVKVTIDNAAGAVHIRKNGNTSDDFAVTGVNTRNGSTNAYANRLKLQCTTYAWNVDDILLVGTTGAVPNDWPGNVRSQQLMPSADSALQFTRSPATATMGTQASSGTFAGSANVVYYNTSGVLAPTAASTLAKITLNLNAGFTGHMKCALYTDGGSGPTTLLGTSNEITNPVTGANDFTFASPPAVVAGNSYYMAFMADASFVIKNNGATTASKAAANTYGSGFPGTGAFGATASPQQALLGTCNLSSYTAVSELQEDGDTSYVFDATVGHTDTYEITDLSTVPTTIIAVVARMFAKKSDTGARSGQMHVVAGVIPTTVDTPGVSLNASYTWQTYLMVTDPETGVAWTAPGINQIKLGPKVSA